jgi:hypothetical protein
MGVLRFSWRPGAAAAAGRAHLSAWNVTLRERFVRRWILACPRASWRRMPSTADDLRASMSRLTPQVREKATEIASALLSAGMDEARAIRIALARSGRWAERRGLHLLSDE